IGAGGMGVVYLGFGDDGKPVAVKVPSAGLADNPEFRSRFRHEVDAARRVRGSSVATVLDADLTGERPWMATEYVEGRSLADAVATRGELDDRLVHGLAIGLADALVAIHAAGVVHRDLKPANILLAWDGPKVIDFGIARAGDSTSHTRTGMLIGTLVWMAPEQLRGERAGPPADIFAWGACVAFAAAGRPPFRGERAEAVGMQILTAEPDLDGLPPDLVGVVRAALEKEPARRPTASELLRRLVGRDVRSPADSDEASETALAQVWSLPPTPPQGAGPLGGARDAGYGPPGGQPQRATGGYPDPTLRDPRSAYDAPPAYGNRAGYDNQAGYGSQAGYGNQAGYDNRPGYDSRAGYDQAGYDQAGYGAAPPRAGGPGYDDRVSGPGGRRGTAPYADQYAAGHGGAGRRADGGWDGAPGGGRGSGDGRRGAVIAVAVLIALLLGGGIAAAVALSSGGGGGDDNVATPPVGTTQDAGGTAGATATGGPAPTTGAASPPSSSPTPSPTPSASPSPATLSTDDAAALVRSKGYEPDMSTYQEDRQLSVVIGTAPASGDTPRQLAYVFADGQFRGTDTSAPSAHVTVKSQRNDHEVVLRYDTYNPQDPIGSPSGHADVRFRWNGSAFSTLDPIPSNDPNATGSRR
ncbi:LppP/LprE family lipoprotein, partial [Frankia sp. AvcI1]